MDIDSINFLPGVYQRRRVEQHRLWRHVALLAVLCTCLGGWWLVQRGQTASLRHEATVYEQEVAAAREQMKQVNELRQAQSRLLERKALWQRLSQPVSHGEVFATLASELPPTVVLTRLDVQTQRPTPTSGETGQSRSRRGGAVVAGLSEPDRLEIDFTGIAPDDLTLANLLNQLQEHLLFENVKLHFSRRTQVHGAVGRQFRIEMQVPLNRTYQRTAMGEEGVAHVD